MAEKRDVSLSILASDGTDVKSGVLSLLQKRTTLLFKGGYELCPLHWRLLCYAGDVYMLGYTRQQPGLKPAKKLSVRGCSTDLALPTKAVVYRHSNENFLCIQKGENLTFLHAETRLSRDKWVDAIRQALTGHTNHANSVRGTADTQPRHAGPGLVNQHRRTAPAGNFPKTRPGPTREDSLDSVHIPSSARALQQETDRRRSSELRYNSTAPSFVSSPNTLQSTQLSRPHSLHGIYSDESTYSGFEECTYLEPNNAGPRVLKSQLSRSEPNLEQLYLPGLYERARSPGGTDSEDCYEQVSDKDQYIEIIDDDDQSSAPSVVHNLPGKQIEDDIYDDVPESSKKNDAPPPPPRDYENFEVALQKKPVSKKKRAPPPPEPKVDKAKPLTNPETDPPRVPNRPGSVSNLHNNDYMDSIEREKTVCLDKPSHASRPYMETVKPSMDNRRAGDAVTEPLSEYVVKFRSELFEVDGVMVSVPKAALSRTTIKLVCVGDQICIAALHIFKLQLKLHVGDVITKVNAQNLPSVNFCYDLFQTTDEADVRLLVKRVPHGTLSHVTMTANGNIASLGLQFENNAQGIEITKIQNTGLVAKSGHPSQPRACGVVNGGTPVNWGLVEINQSPVSLESTPQEVMEQLRSAGCELALVFLPMDIVHLFKEKYCDDKEDCCG